MTVGCARCHDHKLDAISQKDYYALAGMFMKPRWTPRDVALPGVNAPSIAELGRLRGEIQTSLAAAWGREALAFSGATLRERLRADAEGGRGPSRLAQPRDQRLREDLDREERGPRGAARHEARVRPRGQGGDEDREAGGPCERSLRPARLQPREQGPRQGEPRHAPAGEGEDDQVVVERPHDDLQREERRHEGGERHPREGPHLGAPAPGRAPGQRQPYQEDEGEEPGGDRVAAVVHRFRGLRGAPTG
ncbi:MAG: DUF1549 domain-containing protein [Verrucomicrobiota bacterium]